MPKWNGGVIGVANNPTISSAKGIWSLSEATKAIRAGLWPPSNAGADPYFENVTMLLSANGTDGTNNSSFLDSSGNGLHPNRSGNTTQGTFTPFSKVDGRWSNYFNGSSNIFSGSNAAFGFGTGDFTVEFWLFLSVIPASGSKYTLVDFRPTNGATPHTMYVANSSGTLYLGFYDGSADVTSSSQSVTANTWVHCAYSRASGTLKIYVNGNQAYSAANTVDYQATRNLTIGTSVGVTEGTTGYFSNFRITKGAGLYTTAFNPSTVPLTTTVPSGTVTLLTCQANRFVDASNTVTLSLTSAPSVQTFSPFPTLTAYAAGTNGGSGYFDTTGDFLSVTGSSATNFNGVDWTIECWFFKVTLSGGNDSIIQSTTGTNSWVPYLALSTNNDRTIGVSLNAVNYSSTQTYNLNAWNHVAVVRSGGVIKVYLNGAATSISVTADITNSNLSFWIGKVDNAPGGGGYLYYFNGYISDLRVLKGTAQYTSAFTPPTAPLTAITNTSLLCNFTNGGIIDAAMSNDLETVGGAQISTTQSKFGGASMYFDGGGDYLVSRANSGLALGSGDFTTEMWLYPTAFASYVSVWSCTNSVSVATGFHIGFDSSGQLFIYQNSAFRLGPSSTSGTLTLNQWNHVALVRYSGVVKFYVNGVAASTTWSTTQDFSQGFILIGANPAGGSEYYTGYIDDLRITKGYARYTANFTAPSAPFVTFGD